MKTIAPLFMTLVLAAGAGRPVVACCFYSELTQPTFRKHAADSKLIVYGFVQNAIKGPGDDPLFGTTELVVTLSLRTDPALAGRKVLSLPRYIPNEDPKKPRHFLIFADVAAGKVDPWKGVEGGPEALEYLRGLLAIDPKDGVALLRYCFDHLDHPTVDVRLDSYREFLQAPDPLVNRAARGLDPVRLRRWLCDDTTTATFSAMYGFLLGHCGNDADADLLRKFILAHRQKNNSLDGPMTGYVLLRPRQGWDFVRQMTDPKEDFLTRYAAFRTARFLRTNRPAVIADKEIQTLLAELIEQEDVADFAIDELRKWKVWERTERILALYEAKSHQVNIVRRAIMRYALVCPEDRAAKFVARQRQLDPKYVAETEEMLQLEASP